MKGKTRNSKIRRLHYLIWSYPSGTIFYLPNSKMEISVIDLTQLISKNPFVKFETYN